MNSTSKVIGIVAFGVLTSFVLPHLINVNSTSVFKTSSTENKVSSNSLVAVTEDAEDTAVPVETEKEIQENTQSVEQETQQTAQIQEETQAQPVVYDGMTMDELTEKLNRSLKSTLANTGNIFAKDAVNLGIDPYLAVAIVLHETGCSYSCSKLVKESYNVGGMKSDGSYLKFNSIEEGIHSFMNNLSKKYVSLGLDTAEKMNSKYAASTTWATKVNNYIEKIKNA